VALHVVVHPAAVGPRTVDAGPGDDDVRDRPHPATLLVEDDQREDDIFVVNVCIIGPGKSLAFTAKGLSA
jgi:hypothetical protein